MPFLFVLLAVEFLFRLRRLLADKAHRRLDAAAVG